MAETEETTDALENANSVVLKPRECVIAATLVLVVVIGWPLLRRFEATSPSPNFRVPYALSEDHWLYDLRGWPIATEGGIPVVGDSVIWGHFVRSDETLSACLGYTPGGSPHANLGLDGAHPAALSGLMRYHTSWMTRTPRRIILHCNPLWLASEVEHLHDADSDFPLNHERLIPQFRPRIATYKAPRSDRIGVAVERRLPFRNYARHLQWMYLDGLDFSSWTIEHPYEFPKLSRQEMPVDDTPPGDARTWRQRGMTSRDLPWIALDESIHWACFIEAVEVLRDRGCPVYVFIGPLNEHMLTDTSRAKYNALRGAMADRLRALGVPCFVPPTLPSDEYADASHPLAAGYRRLAEMIRAADAFRRFNNGETGK